MRKHEVSECRASTLDTELKSLIGQANSNSQGVANQTLVISQILAAEINENTAMEISEVETINNRTALNRTVKVMEQQAKAAKGLNRLTKLLTDIPHFPKQEFVYLRQNSLTIV